MPEISRFYGIVIKMYFDEHPPPHFHAIYGEHEAVFDIHNWVVVHGYLPPRVMGMVIEWASQHQNDLLALWECAAKREKLYRLPPLQ